MGHGLMVRILKGVVSFVFTFHLGSSHIPAFQAFAPTLVRWETGRRMMLRSHKGRLVSDASPNAAYFKFGALACHEA